MCLPLFAKIVSEGDEETDESVHCAPSFSWKRDVAAKTKKANSAYWTTIAEVSLAAAVRSHYFWIAASGVGLLVAFNTAWESQREEIESDPRFRLSAEKLYVTPKPAWLKSEILNAAMLDGSLKDCSLLNPDVVEKVHNAFSLQPAVGAVRRVQKSAHGIQVDIEYRVPLAMVEIVHEGTPKLQPVDRHGVLLPGTEFSEIETTHYVRISVDSPNTTGLINGSRWGDGRIEAASRIAEVIEPVREKLGIYRIRQIELAPPSPYSTAKLLTNEPEYVSTSSEESPRILPTLLDHSPIEDENAGVTPPPRFELHVVNADHQLCRRVIWGHAPGAEENGENTVDSKLAKLISHFENNPNWLRADASSYDLPPIDITR